MHKIISVHLFHTSCKIKIKDNYNKNAIQIYAKVLQNFSSFLHKELEMLSIYVCINKQLTGFQNVPAFSQK
jgi:hypothetical protein